MYILISSPITERKIQNGKADSCVELGTLLQFTSNCCSRKQRLKLLKCMNIFKKNHLIPMCTRRCLCGGRSLLVKKKWQIVALNAWSVSSNIFECDGLLTEKVVRYKTGPDPWLRNNDSARPQKFSKRKNREESVLPLCLPGKKVASSIHWSELNDTRRDRVNGVLVNTFSWANTRKFKERRPLTRLAVHSIAFQCTMGCFLPK